MESFVPSIEEQLRLRVAGAVESTSPDADHATVTLTSFQFAFDQREDILGEYQANYANWAAVKDREDEEREARRDVKGDEQRKKQLESDESMESMIFGEILTDSFTMLFIDYPRSLVRKYATNKRTFAEAQTLPPEITDGKQAGLNCQIHATVIFAGRQGAEVKRTVRINRHAPLTDDGSIKDQTAALIEAALEEFSSSI